MRFAAEGPDAPQTVLPHLGGPTGRRAAALLHTLSGRMRGDIRVESDFCCDYGCNLHAGENFYANHGCVLLDARHPHRGHFPDRPQISLYTAGYPPEPATRSQGFAFAQPVTLSGSGWIGGHATVLPDATSGDSVVVTNRREGHQELGDQVAIGGNPCGCISH